MFEVREMKRMNAKIRRKAGKKKERKEMSMESVSMQKSKKKRRWGGRKGREGKESNTKRGNDNKERGKERRKVSINARTQAELRVCATNLTKS